VSQVPNKHSYSSFENDTATPNWPLLGRLQRAVKFGIYTLIAWFDRLTLPSRKPAVFRHIVGQGRRTTAGTLCIFAHYDSEDRVDEYVLYSLQKIQELGSDIIFVSTASLMDDDCIKKLSPHCAHILVRENLGYDFGSWKIGLEHAHNLSAYQRLILANDSVYGPLHDVRDLFADMHQRGAAVWAITDSYELKHHLQSYFLVFERPALENPAFGEFWNNLPFYRFKRSVIREGEIGLPARLSRAGLRTAAAFGYGALRKNHPEVVLEAERRSPFAGPLNPTRSLWDLLVCDCRCPFLKVDVLRDNPESSPLVGDWPQMLANVSNYNPRIIERHLARMHDRS
jgi:lipopolysaccharide biosynthesis protein